MIYKITSYFLLPMLLLSLFLSLAGVQQIQFGDTYYSFMRSVTQSFNSWKLEIPKLKPIDVLTDSNLDGTGGILEVLRNIGNFFVTIVNGLIGLVNIVVTAVNIVINIVQFVLTIVYQCKDFINRVSPNVV